MNKRRIFFVFVLGGGVFALLALFVKPQVIETSSFRLTSPLPQLFTNSTPKVLASHEFWKPMITEPKSLPDGISHFTSQAILSFDVTTGTLIAGKNIEHRMPLASLTKIMTAIVTIENENLEERVEISANAASVGENSMGLGENERIKRRDLLYGLILPSGNDAAEALADSSSVTRENFVYLMNKKAEDLGLTNTRFTNPSGLEGDGNQYSTAYDLLVMTKYGLDNPEFAKVVSTVEYQIPASATNKYYSLYNDTNLLTTYPGVKGVKTGYTYEAGMCLVTYLEYDGHKIIAVLLNSENRREEMKQLLDYSLSSLGATPPNHQ